MSEYWWLYIAGLLTVPIGKFLISVVVPLRWACHDTWRLWRHGTLKAKYTKIDWLWILPVKFFKSWWCTWWDSLGGWHRSG